MTGLLKEDNGLYSSNRFVFIVFTIVVVLVWATLSIKSGVLLSIPDSIVTIIGTLAAAKVIQKHIEE